MKGFSTFNVQRKLPLFLAKRNFIPIDTIQPSNIYDTLKSVQSVSLSDACHSSNRGYLAKAVNDKTSYTMLESVIVTR
jgi:hypothetical protein